MSLRTAVLIASFVASQFAGSIATNAAAEYVLDSSIDACEEAGQHQIKNNIISLLQIPKDLPPKTMRWPKDSLEDADGWAHGMVERIPEDRRWKFIGMAKAFNPIFFMETLMKEVRDNLLCNLKRMECMSIDDISTPIESMTGTRAIYAMIDALPEDMKPAYYFMVAEVRRRVIEPMQLIMYRTMVKPQKDMVEGLVPKGYPYDVIPSMPSDKEGDWDVTGNYPSVGTASLPTPQGSAWRLNKQSRFSLLQTAEKSRQKCNDKSTETKKILCHLDFGIVQSKIMRRMRKGGELPELSKKEQDDALAQLDQIDAQMTEMKKNHRTACIKARDV